MFRKTLSMYPINVVFMSCKVKKRESPEYYTIVFWFFFGFFFFLRDRALRVHTHAQRSVKLLIFLHQNSKLKNNFTGKLCLKVSSWKLSGLRYEFGLFTPRKSIKHCGFHSELKLLEFQVSLTQANGLASVLAP